jgi:hypothetical protein
MELSDAIEVALRYPGGNNLVTENEMQRGRAGTESVDNYRRTAVYISQLALCLCSYSRRYYSPR